MVPTGRPTFRQIADEIRQAITTGQYASATTMPPEPALAAQFGVSPETARYLDPAASSLSPSVRP